MASKLAEHRRRKPRSGSDLQPALPLDGMMPPSRRSIASSVAARFSKRVSYHEFLQHEAEAAIHQAEAEAEVARRTADAIVAAQQQLLDEIDHWNAHDASERGPADVIAMTAATEAVAVPQLDAAPAAADEPFTMTAPEPAVSRQRGTRSAAKAVQPNVASQPDVAAPDAPAPLGQSAAARLLEQLPPEPLEPAVPLPTNLIEFPRQLIAARKARPRLAEGPLREEADTTSERAQLRIFEVEASSVSTVPAVESVLPEWHTIRLDMPEPSGDAAHPGEEISFAPPILVAPRSLRSMAMLVDGCCIATSFLLAVAAAAYVSPVLPTGLPALMVSGATLFALWLFYQLLFFSVSDATPGMRYARIGLCTFSDENPTRSAMLKRIGARLLAGMPLGLGLLWACLDEEGLGWHDRISRMYPRAY